MLKPMSETTRHMIVTVTGLLVWALSGDAPAREMDSGTSMEIASDSSRPVAAWARHAWQSPDGLPEGPINAIVPLTDGSLLAAGRTQRARFAAGGLQPLAADDPRCHKLADVPLDPWLAAGRTAKGPYTSRCRAADGTVFSGFVHGPPSRSRDGIEHRFQLEDGVRLETASHVAIDAQGRVWLAQSGLLAVYDPQRGQFDSRVELPAGRMTIAPGRDGGLWIKINQKVYRYQDDAGLRPVAGNAPHGFTILFEDSAGRLWVGSDFFGLHLRDGDSFKPVATVGEGVFALAEDMEGGLWVGTSTAANRLWPGVIRSVIAPDIGLQLPNSMCEDSDGRIWIAAEGGRLSRVEARGPAATFTPITTADGWEGIAHRVAAGPDGTVFVGTRTDGISRHDGERFEKIEPPPGTPPKLAVGEYRIEHLLATRGGDLWAVTGEGLFRRRAGQWKKAAVADVRAADLRQPRALIEDDAGTVWVATGDGSLCRFTAGGGTEASGEPLVIEPAPGGRISGLAATPEGSIWAAVRDVGLLRIRGGQATWVGADAGLPSVGIVAVAADTTGLLWCIASRQIFAVTREELDAFADGSRGRLHPWIFSGEDEGVAIDPADRPQCQTLLADDGSIWITLRRGLLVVDPSRLPRPTVPPSVVVKEVRVGGRRVPFESVKPPASSAVRVALPPDPRGVEIEIAAGSFARPSNARIAYRLEGFDTGWVESSGDRAISYERLPVGKYALRVRSEGDRGVNWENGSTSIVLDVRPQVWERPWFRTAAIASAAGIAAILTLGAAAIRTRSRIARLESQTALEEQRMRIARDMHDEAGTTATQLALLADLARAMPDTTARDERLEDVSRIARTLVKSLEEMVWAVNPTNDTLSHLVSYLAQMASETLGTFSVTCRVRCSDSLPDVPATAELRRGMFLIAKEAVSNIVEHAEATAVELDIAVRDGRLLMSITDDGRGMPATNDRRSGGPGGNGLGNMQARAAGLGGSCRIESVTPHGTRLIIDVPLPVEVQA